MGSERIEGVPYQLLILKKVTEPSRNNLGIKDIPMKNSGNSGNEIHINSQIQDLIMEDVI